MRADRLLATLLVLQSKGRVTARELAEELEVSVKTARRDLEALSMAGVPVYPQRGRNGGWMLLGGARTDLTGLTSTEARALFLAAGSAVPTTAGLKDALRKLAQAVPEPFRADATAAAEAVIVDPGRWGPLDGNGAAEAATETSAETQPGSVILDLLQQAVIDRHQVELGYDNPGKGRSIRRIHPLGLVVKASIWYVIALTDDGQRTFRVDRIFSAVLSEQPAQRPVDFDLRAAWDQIQIGYLEQAENIRGKGLAEAWTLRILREIFGGALEVGDTHADGRLEVSFTDYSVESLAARTAGIAHGFEIVEPEEARERCVAIGQSLLERYG